MVTGYLLGGQLLDRFGDATMYLVAASISALALIPYVWLARREPHPTTSPAAPA